MRKINLFQSNKLLLKTHKQIKVITDFDWEISQRLKEDNAIKLLSPGDETRSLHRAGFPQINNKKKHQAK